MMRTAGARIMSISGAWRAQTSPGLPADAHDAGLWGATMGGTTARCTNSPFLVLEMLRLGSWLHWLDCAGLQYNFSIGNVSSWLDGAGL